ncbi:MAG: SCP2 sterol-binding domain-containing protein [Acidimicrobiia bacterium]|nr:SCP2 sterol-binding domain-containing protein [Acidimicrobiia bacterium]
MSAVLYPSPEWFASPNPLPKDTKADLVVEHQCETAAGQTLTHQQAFRNSRLEAWSAGTPFGEPHITLRRSLTDDAGDLLGLSTASCTAANTSVEIGGVVSGVFGFEGFERYGILELTGDLLPVDFRITALASPFGDADVGVRLYKTGRMKTLSADDAEADLSVRATWEDLVQQSLNEEHLMWLMAEKRVKVRGDSYLLSYLNGFLVWPKPWSEELWGQQFHTLMSRYRDCRQNSQYRQDLERLVRQSIRKPPVDPRGSNREPSREKVGR